MNANAQFHRLRRWQLLRALRVATLVGAVSLGPAGRAGKEPPSSPAPAGAAVLAVNAALAQLPSETTGAVTPLWQLRPRRLDYLSLAELLPVGPTWQNLEANSEQRQPLHLGASPREQVLRALAAPRPGCPYR